MIEVEVDRDFRLTEADAPKFVGDMLAEFVGALNIVATRHGFPIETMHRVIADRLLLNVAFWSERYQIDRAELDAMLTVKLDLATSAAVRHNGRVM